ncbi:hypothetical protein CWE12_08540 [Aliidiomarina sedimenti]|uniref:AMMECR1 domain-containing protein n=1 Tax=Aliidiomarina sedimenti TaxID=1933879 RepID=A0ABY0BZK6_9GAMM|nr:hypothetical protein [Aliidiomarina sedimenti]RUO29998.1 hypothetical protein CWE12_08540 [Aliidiomarina sedimenti]
MKLDTGLNEALVVGLSNWLAIKALADDNYAMPQVLKDDQKSMNMRVVFVTLADERGHYATASAMAMNLAQAGQSALDKARVTYQGTEKADKANNAARRKIERVKVDIMADVVPIDEARVKQGLPIVSDRSLVGVILENYDQAWLAEESMREGFVGLKGHLNRAKIRARLGQRINNPDSNKVWIFSTLSRLVLKTSEGQLANLPLLRNHVVNPQLTPEFASEVAKDGADYLARHTTDSGQMNYLFDAANDRVLKGYNILRHAGSLWSMLQVYKDAPTVKLHGACNRALDYLLSTVQAFSPDYPRLKVIAYENEAKLGGNGLALVAMAAAYKYLGRRDILPVMRELADWIVAIQAPNGEFTLHKAYLDTVEKAPFISGYYPGEAILGLMELYKIDRNHKWLNSADRAAKWLIEVRDGDKSIEELERDHWLLYGLNELYQVVPHQQFVDHCKRLLEAITYSQHKKANVPDWIGGFQDPLNITATACMCEGMLAGYRLLSRAGEDAERLATLRTAIEAGLKLQLQFRFDSINSTYLKNPERAEGGFQCRTAHWNIQVDFTQHSLTGFLMYGRYI